MQIGSCVNTGYYMPYQSSVGVKKDAAIVKETQNEFEQNEQQTDVKTDFERLVSNYANKVKQALEEGEPSYQIGSQSTSCVYETANPDDNDVRYITWYTEEGIFCRKAGQTQGYEWTNKGVPDFSMTIGDSMYIDKNKVQWAKYTNSLGARFYTAEEMQQMQMEIIAANQAKLTKLTDLCMPL